MECSGWNPEHNMNSIFHYRRNFCRLYEYFRRIIDIMVKIFHIVANNFKYFPLNI